MGLLRPFLVVQSRTWTLYLPQAPSARTVSVSIVIPASGAVFRPIFARGVPTRTLEMSTHTRSLTLRPSTEVTFGHESLSFMSENGRIRSLRRKSRPRVTCDRNGPELSSLDQKVFVICDMVIFRFRIFIFVFGSWICIQCADFGHIRCT